MPFVLSLDQVRGREALSCGWLLLWAGGRREGSLCYVRESETHKMQNLEIEKKIRGYGL